MLPVCIVGVVIGDFFLYAIGRLWGPRLLQFNWVKTKLLPPERALLADRAYALALEQALVAIAEAGINIEEIFKAAHLGGRRPGKAGGQQDQAQQPFYGGK